MKRALVVNIARMGDLIQSGPLIAGLAEKGFEVALFHSDAFGAVAEMMPGLTRRIPFPLGRIVAPLIKPGGRLADCYLPLRQMLDSLRRERFDLVVNVTHTTYSAALCRLIGGRETSGVTLDRQGERLVKGDWTAYYLNSTLSRQLNRFHIVDIHRLIGDVTESRPPELTVPDDARRRASEMLNSLGLSGRRLVGLVPGASTPEKRYPADGFVAALRDLERSTGTGLLIFGSESERDLTAAIAGALPNACDQGGKTDLATLAALLESCDLLISNDTGTMHIAAAVGTQVLCVVLGSAMAMETAPYGKGHVVVEPVIACHPCLPKQRCGHLACHGYIAPAAIASLAAGMLTDGTFPMLPSSGFRVRRTRLDEEGFLVLELLGSSSDHEPEWPDILRQVWKHFLGKPPTYQEPPGAAIPFALTTIPGLMDLAQLAVRGSELVAKLPDIQRRNGSLNRLEHIAGELKFIDDAVIRLGMQHPHLLPFAGQFTVAKDGLEGEDLERLAASTARLYRSLLGWCRMASDLVSGGEKGVPLPMLPLVGRGFASY
ncbi:MAG: glycosyltransferase family 9 protein [Calditrichaeota bacterium]|nr:glycosyltransferase family 9 protein [Calditrichota bacterium]